MRRSPVPVLVTTEGLLFNFFPEFQSKREQEKQVALSLLIGTVFKSGRDCAPPSTFVTTNCSNWGTTELNCIIRPDSPACFGIESQRLVSICQMMRAADVMLSFGFASIFRKPQMSLIIHAERPPLLEIGHNIIRVHDI